MFSSLSVSLCVCVCVSVSLCLSSKPYLFNRSLSLYTHRHTRGQTKTHTHTEIQTHTHVHGDNPNTDTAYLSLLLILFDRMPKFRWDVIWLPFGPLRYISKFHGYQCDQEVNLNTHIHVIKIAVERESASMWIIYLMNHRKKWENFVAICMLIRPTELTLLIFEAANVYAYGES